MLLCPNCTHQYNSNERVPKILPDCGHTICSFCLSNILKHEDFQQCPEPECFKNFSNRSLNNHKLFQTNFALQRVIETMSNLCSKHHAPMDHLCLVDYQEICINCAKYDDNHKDHPTKPFKEIQDKSKEKIEEIIKKKDEFKQKERKEFLSILEKSREKMNEMVDNSLDKLIIEYRTKQRFFCWDIEAAFLLKQKRNNSPLKNEIEQACRILESNVMNKEYLEVLEKEIVPPVQDNTYLDEIKEFSQQIELQVNEEMTKLSSEKSLFLEEQDLTKILSSDIGDQEERLRIDLEIAKRRYFDIYLEDEVLSIIPVDGRDSFVKFKNTITPAEVSNITKVKLIKMKAKFTESMMIALSTLWKNLNLDIQVEIVYNGQHFDEGDFCHFIRFPFWENISLEDLSINFHECSFQQEIFLPSCLEYTLVKIPNLRVLRLILDSAKISDLTLEGFSKIALPQMGNLEELYLSFDKTQITEKSISVLAENLQNLQTLSINFHTTNFSDLELSSFSDIAFKNLTELDCLIILLHQTQVSQAGIENFIKKLPKKSSSFDIELWNNKYSR